MTARSGGLLELVKTCEDDAVTLTGGSALVMMRLHLLNATEMPQVRAHAVDFRQPNRPIGQHGVT